MPLLLKHFPCSQYSPDVSLRPSVCCELVQPRAQPGPDLPHCSVGWLWESGWCFCVCRCLLLGILAVLELLHSPCAPGSRIISHGCAHCAGINQTQNGGSCLIQLFCLPITSTILVYHNCFFSLLTFPGTIEYSFSGPQVSISPWVGSFCCL